MNTDILNIINNIQTIIGPCEYDDFEDDWPSELMLYSEEYEGLGCEIDVEEKTFCPFVSFPVVGVNCDYSDNDELDLESIELENTSLLGQNSFFFYLKTHAYTYNVCVWDDGGPFGEYVSIVYVGLSSLSEYKGLSDFFNVYKSYQGLTKFFEPNDFRKFIIQTLCQFDGLFHEDIDNLIIGRASIIFHENNELYPDNNVTTFAGNEKFLIIDENTIYYTDKEPVELFLKAIKWCELFGKMTYHLIEKPLFHSTYFNIKTNHMDFIIQVHQSNGRIIENMEEMELISQLSFFQPFATQRLTLALDYYKSEIHPKEIPLIFTEGPTDWKHLKKFIAEFYPELKADFYEFDTKTNLEVSYKSQMGCDELLRECKTYSRMPQERPHIFIADCDVPRISLEMGGETDGFKKWGNNVYSMILPVPQHRLHTPDICIELLYSDTDLNKKHMCTDGTKRKLYISSEFDSNGIHKTESVYCTNKRLCCSRIPRVLDGSHKEKIMRCDHKDEKNYALSKQDFAGYVTIEKESESYTAFNNVVEIIKKIVLDAQLHNE